ncbi:nitric oxide dioxygenase OS=Tsukamurella paurometabola (strain ATCC 8368 / DSM / CCUG 35730/ CIP 100753 / JCM 10117 / KCTC 9821 / NBRC 16120 / NCIMB 702349/ NCTC 13040) OX=521096 GN=Tpau_0492 PE=3 SV=1 [Tsukamurella paurometabola]|uniref:nitric oxide dioxygenase n=1 Tax=Tsukamurella paurometabola (strain ATCC 8368 / DSM 20162 / CCUG 35730 / CIP 100753 / JCM 10117 / KCTC 9821 / NBRC 16120 / NCIMB 702349 / NCTC 13040) TaxID=521096 RepID=D5US66_TSUPD|nr:FAD-binding oxidoreductase [Tsukamurella paurometabola]ADG77133.1 oxidoreductase FAD/NAD(P)-binding domain protein [Tsukamurella paurometabola DSM 20162]SUP42893.1 Phenol hydroxylase P5 protein [Tsukamurella paurometabola]
MGSHSRHGLTQIAADLRPVSDDFTKRLFARLFALDPSLRELFPASMSSHREVFFRVLDHVFSAIPEADEHDELIEFLAQLGRDHRKYGLTEAHYTTMATALSAEVRALYQPHGGLDAEDSAVLDQAVQMMTGVMRGGAHSDPTPARRSAEVVEVLRPHPGLTVVRLIAEQPLLFRPGQYVETQIPQVPRQWRPFSLAMPPNTQGQMEFHVRAVPGGDLSSTIHSETRPGDRWQFGQVHGLMRADGARPVTLIAGGTGLAPMKSILLAMAASAHNPETHLVMGARSPGQLYDAESLAMLAATNPWLRITQVTDARRDPWWLTTPAPPARGLPLRHGSVVEAMRALDLRGHRVLIAGPAGLVHAARNTALSAGAEPDQVLHDPI